MKQAFTWLLFLAASLLLHPSGTLAQVGSPQLSSKVQRTLPALRPQVALPAGVPALRHPLPGANESLSANRPAPARPPQKIGASARGTNAQSSTTGSATEAWVARFSESGTVENEAKDMVVDAAGNVYVTGYSFRNGSNDFATVKYSSDGQQLWSARYNSAGNGNDVATDMAVDAAGNVYVTGYSAEGGSRLSRYVTIKYAANGQQLWVSLGTVSSIIVDDRPTDVVVDAAGTVYVTGSGYSAERRYYYTTLQYSASGNILGTIIFTGDENYGFGSRLALDAAGNFYVVGSSNSDYFTRKYSAAGQLQWTASYNGPDNSIDNATSVTVDAAGNVYVSGASKSITSANDYATVKYSASGQQLWAARYNSPNLFSDDQPTDLAVDAAGNVFVTGTAYGGPTRFDYATVKYSATGEQQWAALYGGVQNDGVEQAYSLALDAAGDVYVTGYSSVTSSALGSNLATVKYASATGQQLWEARYTGIGFNGTYHPVTVAVDATGSVYVTGTSGSSAYTTIKYQQNDVQQLWEARFNAAANGAEVAKDIATDAAGNVYVTGYAYNGRNYDYATVKYSPTGQQLWQAHYDGPANGDEVPTDLAVDAAGNVVVTGYSLGTGSSYDYATVKYSSSGQQLWSARLNGPSNSEDFAFSVALDATGGVFVTGAARANGKGPFPGDFEYLTVKYSASGQELWMSQYIGQPYAPNVATAVVVDAAGNAYVTGYSQRSSLDYVTIKYAANGQSLWIARSGGFGNDIATAVAVDLLGNVYVTGSSDPSGDGRNYDYATFKYSPSGQELWETRYNGSGNSHDLAADLALDAAGNVYVTGTSDRGGNWDYVTLKYASGNGQPQWEAHYDGPDSSYDEAAALALDGANNVYVTGLSYNRDGTNDYATLKYAATGQQLWEARYNGPGNSYDEAAALAVDSSNNVYVTGFSHGSGTGYDYATLKYSQSTGAGPVALAGAAPLVAASAPLAVAAPTRQLHELSVYPNPATGPTTVSFRPVQDGAAQVRIYNQLGQQVVMLYEGKVRKGQHYELPLHSEKLTAGLYTCSLLVNGQRETVRLLINR
ncbi:SBBP repeat-containing protein [Hymenobacter sp. YC55]|uniref:SBBP repeat-containing protein n=1 Tax=Hymenobacter sp. YC55 TaxID=3034019 RepID=UPI0023F81B16|nr:SBBP repeat-containing protein [Hymenobacter sp. YC55]MDF7812052.1 SBBP repeat-containing protein [Hymenobacter sp. YC55]